MTASGSYLRARHPITGRFLAFDCETDCLQHRAGLCGEAMFYTEGDDVDAHIDWVRWVYGGAP
jgi:hypothetical protein